MCTYTMRRNAEQTANANIRIVRCLLVSLSVRTDQSHSAKFGIRWFRQTHTRLFVSSSAHPSARVVLRVVRH